MDPTRDERSHPQRPQIERMTAVRTAPAVSDEMRGYVRQGGASHGVELVHSTSSSPSLHRAPTIVPIPDHPRMVDPVHPIGAGAGLSLFGTSKAHLIPPPLSTDLVLALAADSIRSSRSTGVVATKRSVGTLGEADLKGKVFLRADLNVPLDDAQNITDDTGIRASVPTIKFLLEKGAKVVLASHLDQFCDARFWC